MRDVKKFEELLEGEYKAAYEDARSTATQQRNAIRRTAEAQFSAAMAEADDRYEKVTRRALFQQVRAQVNKELEEAENGPAARV